MAARRRGAFRRHVLYPLEAVAAVLVYGFLWLLPLDAASWLGGCLGRAIGPLLPVHRLARRNLERAFPEKGEAEIAVILRGMWDNLGRVLGEWPHLSEFRFYEEGGRISVSGVENVDLMRDDGKAGIFFTAHFGNWEIATLAAIQRGVPLDEIYRAANNPLVDRLIVRARRAHEGSLHRKGPQGARHLIAALKAGRHLGMLVDQKMNDGIPVPFFGRDAMTAPALAEFALRYDCPVIPARVIRERGARFRMVIEPPFPVLRSGDHHADVAATMARVNAHIEDWIRQHPEQWFWVHKRWPD